VSRSFTEDHHVDLADGRGIVGCLHLGQMDRPVAFKRDAILLHGFEAVAARDERHVGAAVLQPRTVIAADTARTHDRDLQRCLPPVTGLVPCAAGCCAIVANPAP